MAVLLAVLGLLSVVTLITGVLGVVTGRSYVPTVIWRLRRRRTPASAEDERLLGMSITLYAVFGLLMTVQSGAIAIVSTTGWRSPHAPAFALATMIGLVVVFCVDHHSLVRLRPSDSAFGMSSVGQIDYRPKPILARGQPSERTRDGRGPKNQWQRS